MALTAKRRHERDRFFRRALAIASIVSPRGDKDPEWRRMWARKITKNRKICSNWRNGNPRRYFKGGDRLTIAEKRARCHKDTHLG